MYQLIQQYGDEGRYGSSPTLPVPALVEDEFGQRILLCGPMVKIQAWADASASGAQGLLRVLGGPSAFLSAEDFARYRIENPFAAAYEVAEQYWFGAEPDAFFTMDQAAHAKPELTNPFVHLHTHSEFSSFDGLSTMDEIVTAVLADDQSAVAVTDHGICAGHPALHKATRDSGVKPIYGIEAYFREDRFATDGGQFGYQHLVLWAMDDQGLQNLWALSTEGYRDGFYGKPCIDWDTLARLNRGLLASSACLGGPLLAPYLAGDEQRAVANLARLGDLFGDRLYIELHTNHLADQLRGNDWLVRLAAKYAVPTIAVVDSHYPTKADQARHQTWIAMQTKADVSEETELFSGNQDYHLLTADEVRRELQYLGPSVAEQAIANTGALAERCHAEIRPRKVMPRYSKASPEHPDRAAHDIQRMLDGALANWSERITAKGVDEQQYLEPFRFQADMLIRKGFPGYFLITADYVCWAKDNGILVGPGRGSGSASLIAYLLRITEIDPIKADLLFGRFMTEGRDSLPDFDIDFPSSKTEDVIAYTQRRWGGDHVARVGSHTRIKNKSAIKDVQRAIASRLPADSFALANQISKIIDMAESSTAGLGLSWDELFAQVGDLLEPYREKMPELFELAAHFRGRLKGYSKHAAGIIIDPDHPLVDTLPMRAGDPGQPMVTQFDMDALEYLGQIKFDFLSITNLDTIQDTVDLVERYTGDRINPYAWRHEYEDPSVWQNISDGWTMGMFQIETHLGTRTVKQIRPTSLDELSDCITVGRPGPMRSGLDKLYMRRRAGEEPVSYPDERLAPVLNRTWGVMLYQEDIMAVCNVLAGYDDDEADNVRRILGKKKVEAARQEGHKFIERAVANHTDRRVAEEIWAQMEEFAKYSFNRAHAYSYATLAYWTGWPKTHFARETLTAAMGRVDKDRIPQFVGEARRLGYRVLPPDINISGRGFTADGLVVRYGLESVSGVGAISAEAILQAQPYASYEDFLERKGDKCNVGHIKKLARVGAFDSLVANRRGLEARIEADDTGESTKCQFKDLTFVNDHNLPCHFDWSSEPIKLGRSGKPLAESSQPKPPKKCTKACRHYTPKAAVDYDELVQPYTEEEIRDIEYELLGVYLSSSPFDRIPHEVLSELLTGDELMTADYGAYPVAVIITSARPDPKGRDFGFATLNTPAGDLSTVVFARRWERYKPLLTKGRMGLAEIVKTERGFQLNELLPL